jgi:hypothetical protein
MASKPKGVVDTVVLRGANRRLKTTRAGRALFLTNLSIICCVTEKKVTLLISDSLIAEYNKTIKSPFNDSVVAFFDVITNPKSEIRPISNFSALKEVREKAGKIRFPPEDYHLLRTAKISGKKKSKTIIVSTEGRLLAVGDQCVAAFGISILKEWP